MITKRAVVLVQPIDAYLSVSLKPYAGTGQTLMVELTDVAKVWTHEGVFRIRYTEHQNCTIIGLDGNPVPFADSFTEIPPDGGLRIEGSPSEIVVRVVRLVQEWVWE